MKQGMMFVIAGLVVSLLHFPGVSLAAGSDTATDVEKSAVTLKKGTPVQLVLSETYSSQSSKTGDIVRYKITGDVTVDGTVVIPAGSEAVGKVVNARPAKGWGRGGKLEISVESVKAIGGTTVALSAALGDSQEWNAIKTLGGVALFGAAFGGAMKGKKVELGAGTKLDVFVAQDTPINPAGAAPAGAPMHQNIDSLCMNLCKTQTGDAFKKCMTSCDGCKPICKDLSGDDLSICMSKCL